MTDNIVTGSFGGMPFRVNADLLDRLNEVIQEYSGRISTAEVIGVLRILEYGIITNGLDYD